MQILYEMFVKQITLSDENILITNVKMVSLILNGNSNSWTL